jgi:hypothetical protein
MKLKRGKASDLDNLSAEHVIYSNPLLSVALCKLYNVMLLTAYMYQTPLVIVTLYQYQKLTTVL